MVVEGIGEGVALTVMAGTEVAAEVGEIGDSSAPQAADKDRTASKATTSKAPNLIRHHPNTWMLFSCYGPWRPSPAALVP